MPDMDELRDRIRAALWSAQTPDGMRAAMRPDCDAMAKAVIDDLGLTVVYAPAWDGEPSMSGEPHRMSVGSESRNREGVENVIKAWERRGDKPNLRVESRVVGKWEPEGKS